MKRDMDLIREILFEIEKAEDFDLAIEISIEGRDAKEINYHLKILYQAGLIEAIGTSGFGESSEWIATSMTWAGHEFLDSAREEKRWRQAKDMVLKRGGGLVFEVLRKVLIDLATGSVTPLIKHAIQQYSS